MDDWAGQVDQWISIHVPREGDDEKGECSIWRLI